MRLQLSTRRPGRRSCRTQASPAGGEAGHEGGEGDSFGITLSQAPTPIGDAAGALHRGRCGGGRRSIDLEPPSAGQVKSPKYPLFGDRSSPSCLLARLTRGTRRPAHALVTYVLITRHVRATATLYPPHRSAGSRARRPCALPEAHRLMSYLSSL